MSLPSKYAPGGIGAIERDQTITTGKYSKKPVEYTIKTIENKVAQAVNHSINEEDIEMVPIDEMNEVNVISDYITQSRASHLNDSDVMEVDGMYGDMNIEPNTSYLVIDTNFILAHLKLLDSIKSTALKYHLRIIIPLAVMKELDGLKGSVKLVDKVDLLGDLLSDKTIGHLARWANDWIYNELSDVNSVVKGQKFKQRLDPTATKDDAILDCCLYFKEKYTENLVVLLSNDKNLCLKALANEVLTVSFKQGMTSELISETIYNESIRLYGSTTLDGAGGGDYITIDPIASNVNNNHDSIRHSPSVLRFEIGSKTIFNEVTVLVKSAIHHVMVHTYDDDLDLIQDYDRENIIDLHDCVKVINRFWVSSFNEYLRNTNFREGFITTTPKNRDELIIFVKQWSQLLTIIYDRLLDETQNEALERLIQRWNSLLKG